MMKFEAEPDGQLISQAPFPAISKDRTGCSATVLAILTGRSVDAPHWRPQSRSKGSKPNCITTVKQLSAAEKKQASPPPRVVCSEGHPAVNRTPEPNLTREKELPC